MPGTVLWVYSYLPVAKGLSWSAEDIFLELTIFLRAILHFKHIMCWLLESDLLNCACLESCTTVDVERPREMESYLLGWLSLLCLLLSFSFGSWNDGLVLQMKAEDFCQLANCLTHIRYVRLTEHRSPAAGLPFWECLNRKPLISLCKKGAQSRYFNIFQFSRRKPEHGCCYQGNHLLLPCVLCIRISLHLFTLQGNIIAPCLGKGF